jgi:hypothetical protein
VAHQFISKLGMKKRLIASVHLSTLMRCKHSEYGPGAELVLGSPEFKWAQSRRVSIMPFSMASDVIPPAEEIEYELAILGLTEMYRTDKLASLCGGVGAVDLRPKRHPIAHRIPSKEELEAYIDLYSGTPHEAFLRELLE